jgi:hypothetical protein
MVSRAHYAGDGGSEAWISCRAVFHIIFQGKRRFTGVNMSLIPNIRASAPRTSSLIRKLTTTFPSLISGRSLS